MFHQKVHKWRRMSSILLYSGPIESYTMFVVKLERFRPESDLSYLSGIYHERPRIMAEKTWLTAKLCRGLSWNCR